MKCVHFSRGEDILLFSLPESRNEEQKENVYHERDNVVIQKIAQGDICCMRVAHNDSVKDGSAATSSFGDSCQRNPETNEKKAFHGDCRAHSRMSVDPREEVAASAELKDEVEGLGILPALRFFLRGERPTQ